MFSVVYFHTISAHLYCRLFIFDRPISVVYFRSSIIDRPISIVYFCKYIVRPFSVNYCWSSFFAHRSSVSILFSRIYIVRCSFLVDQFRWSIIGRLFSVVQFRLSIIGRLFSVVQFRLFVFGRPISSISFRKDIRLSIFSPLFLVAFFQSSVVRFRSLISVLFLFTYIVGCSFSNIQFRFSISGHLSSVVQLQSSIFASISFVHFQSIIVGCLCFSVIGRMFSVVDRHSSMRNPTFPHSNGIQRSNSDRYT